VLVDVGVPVGHAIATVHDRRAAMRAELQALAPNATLPQPPRKRMRDTRAALRPAEEEKEG
jgi:hypothetical protein